MKRLAIIGAGELGQQIAYYARDDRQYDVVGYFDDTRGRGDLINDIPVIGKLEDIKPSFACGLFDEILLGIGYKHMSSREDIYNQYCGEIPFGRMIHSTSIIDQSSQIGAGVVIYPGCIVDREVTVQPNVLVNIGCCIAHNSIIGSHSFLAPRVAIAGFVCVGNKCILGINATIIDNINMCDHVQIGGGGVVIRNIGESGVYVGNPVRSIRR